MSNSNVYCEVLPNGLTILLREAHLAPVANLQIWTSVGSADERPGEEGLAHFHEHMLFKGTERRGVGEIAGAVEGAGGRINAYTSFDVTVYHATLPSEALGVGLDVLGDAVRNSIFDPEEVKRETEVVLEEIRRSEDSPGHVLGDAVFDAAFTTHPYRAPILGPASNVAGFDRQQVTDFFRRWYAPENLTIVAAGDFDSREFAREIRETFGDAQPGTTQRARPVEPPHAATQTRILRRDFEGIRLDLSWSSVRFRDPDATYLELLAFILGECESSRLVRTVKERDGLASRIDCSSYSPLDPGLFSIDFESEADKTERALEAIGTQIERLRREPVSDAELTRAKTNFFATEQFERESVSGMATKLGSFHVLGGDWQSEERYFETIRSATAEDLLTAANRHLANENLTVGVLLPEDELPDLDHDRICDALDRGQARARSALTPPRRSATLTPKTGWASEIVSYELPGGSSIHVSPRHDVPVVALRAAFRGGLLCENRENAGLGSFLTGMWLRGTQTRSAAGFARSSENLAADIDGFAGRNSLGITLDVTKDQFDPALELFAEALSEPAFDAEELERERRETLANIERREDRLAQQAFQLFGEALYPDHPYRQPLIGYHESVSSFDTASVAAHHQRLIRANRFDIAAAGDLDPDATAAAIAAKLGSLSVTPEAVALPAMDPEPDGIHDLRREKDREQAHLVIGFRGLTLDDPDRHALEIISQMLAGQGGRLFLELRDRQSLAYTVSASNLEGIAPGFFALYIATAPEKEKAARAGIFAELERLVNEKPGEDELERAIQYLLGNAVIDQQRNSSHAAHIALDALYGLGPDAHQHYAEKVRATTTEDLLRVAQRVIRLDRYTAALITSKS